MHVYNSMILGFEKSVTFNLKSMTMIQLFSVNGLGISVDSKHQLLLDLFCLLNEFINVKKLSGPTLRMNNGNRFKEIAGLRAKMYH